MSLTILEVLENYANLQPNHKAFIFLANGETKESSITYGELVLQAKGFAGFLQERVNPEDRILLSFLPGLDFITAFLGCLYAKTIAVPTYPLHNNYHANRLLTLISDCNPALICGTAKSLALMRNDPEFSSYQYAVTDEILFSNNFQKLNISDHDIALLQYTSGSTGAPKGVIVDHGNIMSNQLALHHFLRANPKEVGMSWLPMQHDMGLIGGILYNIYSGTTSVLLPPSLILEKPIRWLNIMDTYKGVYTGGPNFAYQLCVDKITDEEISHLDLSKWRRACNGSEPIRAETIRNFIKKFSKYGFSESAFLCCYGMAEATLLISGSEIGKRNTFLCLDEAELTKGYFKKLDKGGKEFVSSGVVHESFELKIVDFDTLTVAEEGKVGEIWLNGPCVAQGYWHQPELTQQVFHARLPNDEKHYLRTGDLGYLDGKELYVTGRLKDLIIIQGRNIYPQDIEGIVEKSHPAIQPASTAAFSVEINGQERLIIVAEVNRSYRKMDFTPLFQLIRQNVLNSSEVVPYSIHLLPPVRALRTTSGKIQRQATRQSYISGSLALLAKDDLFSDQIPSEAELSNEIIQLIIKMLGVNESKKIDENTSLFSLGFGSLALNMMKLTIDERLRAYGTQLPIEIFYQDISLKELSQYINTQLKMCSKQKLVLSPAFHAERTVPLAYTQLAYWLDKVVGKRSLSFRVHLSGALDIARFEWSINQILARHDAFWCIISSFKPIQRLAQVSTFKLPVFTAQPNGAPFDAESVKSFFRKNMLAPFRWNTLPLFKAYLIQISDTEFDFAFFAPHINVDGGCANILYKELKHYYLSNEPLPPLSATFIDHVFWEREILSVNCEEKHQFWDNYVGYEGVFKIPHRLLTTTRQLHVGNLHSFVIPETVNTAFIAFCRAHRVTVEQGYLLVLRIMLYCMSKQKTLFISYIRHGRYDKRLDDLIGNFITIDLYKLVIDEAYTFDQFLAEFNKELLYAAPYQDGNFIDKFFSLLRQTFSFRKADLVLGSLLNPLLNLYFKRYQVDPMITQMFAQFAVEDVLTKIKKAFKRKRQPMDTAITFFNILPSYYQTTAYTFGDIKIDDHSYLETMNINPGEDSILFYLGRDASLRLLLSINGSINAEGQEEMHRYFLHIIELLMKNSETTLGEICSGVC